MKYLALLLIFLISAESKVIEGKVVRVTDGDTVTILTKENKQERIRLDGIDAPEINQDYGRKSREYLASMVAGKTVRVEYKSRDRYGRILGVVYTGRKNVNEEMVKQGLAWQYRYNRDKNYERLQNEAKRKKLNIWSQKAPVDPFDFRNKR